MVLNIPGGPMFWTGYARAARRKAYMSASRKRRRLRFSGSKKISKFKRKRYMRQKKRKSKFEIKYSNIIDESAVACAKKIGAVAAGAGKVLAIRTLSSNVINLPLIFRCWPASNTTKHGMLGSKIYIRKLKIRFLFRYSQTNHAIIPFNIIIFKSKQWSAEIARVSILPDGGLSYPDICSDTGWQPYTKSVQATAGKTVYSKRVLLKPPIQEGDVAADKIYSKCISKVFKINKVYEPANHPISGTDTATYNFSDYYVMIIAPPATATIGTGYDECRYNCWFTFTDV